MAKLVLTNSNVTLGGTDVSAYVASVTLSISVNEVETTSFGTGAVTRVGGLQDGRSDAQGVFLFRFERPDALPSWPRQPVATTVDGQVPVVYRLDLRNPASFFAIQGFEMRDKDVLYVSNAPAAELQKFLTLVFSVVYPVISTVQLVSP